jgi:hypothetical protein
MIFFSIYTFDSTKIINILSRRTIRSERDNKANNSKRRATIPMYEIDLLY